MTAVQASDEYDALRAGAAVAVVARDVLLVHGPDAVSFLHGQLSQDIVQMNPRDSTWSLHLQPTGKLGRLLRVTRLAGDAVMLDIDAGFGADVAAGLERYKIRTKATIELLGEWTQISRRGSAHPARSADPADPASAVEGADAVRARGTSAIDVAAWPSFPGADVLAPTASSVRESASGLPVVDTAVWDAARIEAGVPVMGRELTDGLIPAEAVVAAWAVSFTKGCFVGQELVARIDSRGGNVPRHLRVLRADSPLTAGDAVQLGGKAAGSLTSVAAHPHGGWVAMGLLARAIEPGATVEVGPAKAIVRALPRPDLAAGPTA